MSSFNYFPYFFFQRATHASTHTIQHTIGTFTKLKIIIIFMKNLAYEKRSAIKKLQKATSTQKNEEEVGRNIIIIVKTYKIFYQIRLRYVVACRSMLEKFHFFFLCSSTSNNSRGEKWSSFLKKKKRKTGGRHKERHRQPENLFPVHMSEMCHEWGGKTTERELIFVMISDKIFLRGWKKSEKISKHFQVFFYHLKLIKNCFQLLLFLLRSSGVILLNFFSVKNTMENCWGGRASLISVIYVLRHVIRPKNEFFTFLSVLEFSLLYVCLFIFKIGDRGKNQNEFKMAGFAEGCETTGKNYKNSAILSEKLKMTLLKILGLILKIAISRKF